jgi:membrane associated rhomboid family serine protease
MRERTPRGFKLPSATTLLLLVNLAVFIFQNVNEVYLSWPVKPYLALSGEGLRAGRVWQLFTFQFLSAGMLHFLFNALGLWLLGRPLENMLGRARLLEVYFGSAFLGGLMQALLGLGFPAFFGGPTVGASAGVCGLLATFATLERDRTFLFMFVLPVRAWNLLLVALAIEVFFVLVPADSGVAHAAHLGGLLGGMAYVRWIVRSERRLFDWRPLRDAQPAEELVTASGAPPAIRRRREKRRDEDLPPAEFISQEVDPILDKISAHGLQSLTERERRILEKARSKILKR